MIGLSCGCNNIFLADICKCTTPDITPDKSHNQLAGMGRYMVAIINKAAGDYTQSAPFDIAFLSDIRCELPGWKPFQIHVDLHLAVTLHSPWA